MEVLFGIACVLVALQSFWAVMWCADGGWSWDWDALVPVLVFSTWRESVNKKREKQALMTSRGIDKEEWNSFFGLGRDLVVRYESIPVEHRPVPVSDIVNNVRILNKAKSGGVDAWHFMYCEVSPCNQPGCDDYHKLKNNINGIVEDISAREQAERTAALAASGKDLEMTTHALEQEREIIQSQTKEYKELTC